MTSPNAMDHRCTICAKFSGGTSAIDGTGIKRTGSPASST
jgi:hypothetical protein